MENLKKIRKLKGYKQREIAEYLQMSRSNYSKYERGEHSPDPETLRKLSEFFDVAIDYLVGNIDHPVSLAAMDFVEEYKNTPTDELLERYNIKALGNNLNKEKQKELIETLKNASDDDIKKMLAFLRAIKED